METYKTEGFRSYRKQLEQVKGIEGILYKDCSYEDALHEVRKYIKSKKIQNDDIGNSNPNCKEYLIKKKIKYKEYIKNAVSELKLRVDDYTVDEFIQDALSDIAGYGILDEAFEDDEITDIFVNSETDIFVEKNGVTQRYWKVFRNEAHYLETVERFLKEGGKELNAGDKKIVHSELYGDRLCTIHKSIATRQVSVTIRKHGYINITRDDLVDKEVMSADMADFIGTILKGELNIVYGGLTGSGKTSSLQAIMNHYIDDKRVLVVEDTQEIQLTNENTLQLVSFVGKTKAETVGLDDLIYTSLRLKPRTIFIGEVRGGPDTLASIESAETGHSTVLTMHGGEPINIINRMVSKFLVAMPSLGIEVVERIIGSAIDYICIQDAIPNIGRKVTEICEVGYDFDKRSVVLKPIYKYNFDTEEFEKVNNISPSKVNTMYRRGLRKEDLLRWI